MSSAMVLDPPTRDSDQDARFLCEVFGCPADVAGQILKRTRIASFPRRAVVVRAADRSRFAYIVIIGRAHAILYGIEGQMILLWEFRRGDLFGDLGTLEGAADDSEVVAIDDLELFALEGSDLVLLAEAHASIGLAITRMLLKRLRSTTLRVYEQAALSAAGRVMAEVLRQAREAPDLTIRPAPVIADLALRASTTRETASRTVSALERRGIIDRDGGGLRIVAPRQLEQEIL